LAKSGVVSKQMGNETVRGFVQGNGGDDRQHPSRRRIEHCVQLRTVSRSLPVLPRVTIILRLRKYNDFADQNEPFPEGPNWRRTPRSWVLNPADE
jgi:hypothetical protein